MGLLGTEGCFKWPCPRIWSYRHAIAVVWLFVGMFEKSQRVTLCVLHSGGKWHKEGGQTCGQHRDGHRL